MADPDPKDHFPTFVKLVGNVLDTSAEAEIEHLDVPMVGQKLYKLAGAEFWKVNFGMQVFDHAALAKMPGMPVKFNGEDIGTVTHVQHEQFTSGFDAPKADVSISMKPTPPYASPKSVVEKLIEGLQPDTATWFKKPVDPIKEFKAFEDKVMGKPVPYWEKTAEELAKGPEPITASAYGPLYHKTKKLIEEADAAAFSVDVTVEVTLDEYEKLMGEPPAKPKKPGVYTNFVSGAAQVMIPQIPEYETPFGMATPLAMWEVAALKKGKIKPVPRSKLYATLWDALDPSERTFEKSMELVEQVTASTDAW